MVKKIFKYQWHYPITDKGFTLIEVLLAIFIGSIVLTVLYSSFFQIIKAKDIVENELDLYHEVRTVFSKMTEDFQSAYPRGGVFNNSLEFASSFFSGAKDGDNSRVAFTSLSRQPSLNSMDSDQAEISYYLEPVADSDLFYLVRAENPGIGTDSGGIRYAISESLVRFNLAYLTDNDSEEDYVEELSSDQTGSLPKAVEVTLTMRSSRGEDLQFSTLILIPLGE
ncbi:MAG: prepilin-type N-terminal cleavage/methylation domain-containing protein [Deltaproteobacteria bacterium]|nr:prepilin-type N-terminal cleavage/methylation domain-containing protein [Deltaproteobacteria bacterium]